MAIEYHSLGGQKKVNEMVMAGSHDAAITSGGIRARTQNKSIYQQAKCGVRIFDVRISGQRTGHGGAKLSAFHGKNTPEMKSKTVGGVTRNIEVTRMVLGDWGMDLDDILDGAKRFVDKYQTEFLILKFDKSANYELILEACQNKLGNRIYKKTGNLANHTLSEMAGKVVCAFMPDGFAALSHAGCTIADGAAQIVSLYPHGTMPDTINGLIYYGKGGTSIAQPSKYALKAPVKGKFLENIDKQRRILGDANTAHYSRDVLRMMYWTQTGMVRSIKGRDKKAWTTGSKQRLKSLWAEGGYNYLSNSVPEAFPMDSHATNFQIYMPNFIMVDFADEHKGQTIYDLNLLTRAEIIQLNGGIDQPDDTVGFNI